MVYVSSQSHSSVEKAALLAGFGKAQVRSVPLDAAYAMRADALEAMVQDDILNGRLICEIGIAPVRPAEFVVFRIFQHTAEAQR